MKVKIADLSERITIYRRETTRNQYGDIVKVAEFVRCMVWARLEPKTARIEEKEPARASVIAWRIIIRRRTDIKPDDEILWRGRRLKMITPPYDLDGQKEFTTFEVEEVIEDGAAT